ncbi:MAG: histidine kinase [Actinomycetota bacterium]
MTDRTASRLAWSTWAACIATVLIGSAIGIGHVRANDPGGPAPTITSIIFLIAFSTVGALIASRRRENPIGWLLLVSAMSFAIGGLAVTVDQYSRNAAMQWLSSWVWGVGVFLTMSLPFLLFPDGHLPSRRWRPVAWMAVIGIGAFVLGSVFAPGRIPDTHLRNPLGLGLGGVGRTVFPALRGIGTALSIIAGIPSIASLVVRYQRAGRLEREQIRWLMFAGGLVIVSLFASGPITANLPTALATNIQNAITAGALTLIPVAIGIAVLRYRLYDIDVVISKTLVYGALAAMITVVYVAVVVGIGSLIHTDLALSIAATAMVALAFQPARDRLQRWANRLVYGERATPYEVLARFSERIADTYATEDVLPRTARVIAEGTGAERAEVWLRVGDEVRRSAVWPVDPAIDDTQRLDLVDGNLPVFTGVDRSVPVTYRDELLGSVTVTKRRGDPLTPTEASLLDDLAHQAGLVLSNVRLTAELEARLERITEQAAALRASRRRIVAAQDAERRRLERNIHDGAQQHLVALAVKLRLARGLLMKDPSKAQAMLTELCDQVDDALDTLRALALGIYPPLLEEQGIAAAIAAQYVRSDLPVRLQTDGTGRYPIDTEAAVYFCVLEALQNAAKYSHASAVEVRLTESMAVVSFEVSDDGIGFEMDGAASGTGLAGMRDRLAVLGGDADVWSEPGKGTIVRGRLPIGAAQVLR